MALEPIKIPQNVYIEDHIVGPITLRHIIIMGIGGGISYLIYSTASALNNGATNILITALSWTPTVIAAAFAFVKINDLSLLRIGLLMLERMNKPPQRTFSPRPGLSIHIRTFTEEKAQPKFTVSKEKTEGYRRLDDLTAVLDSPVEHVTAGDTGEEELQVRDTAAAEHAVERQAPSDLLPVNKNRIKVSPLAQQSAQDGEPRAAVSLFRDITAK